MSDELCHFAIYLCCQKDYNDNGCYFLISVQEVSSISRQQNYCVQCIHTTGQTVHSLACHLHREQWNNFFLNIFLSSCYYPLSFYRWVGDWTCPWMRRSSQSEFLCINQMMILGNYVFCLGSWEVVAPTGVVSSVALSPILAVTTRLHGPLGMPRGLRKTRYYGSLQVYSVAYSLVSNYVTTVMVTNSMANGRHRAQRLEPPPPFVFQKWAGLAPLFKWLHWKLF